MTDKTFDLFSKNMRPKKTLGEDWRETAPLRITLSIDHMKHAIVEQVMLYREDMTSHINDVVEAAIAAYDFDGEVRKAADQAIEQAVGTAVKTMIGYQLRAEIEYDVKMKIIMALQKSHKEDGDG